MKIFALSAASLSLLVSATGTLLAQPRFDPHQDHGRPDQQQYDPRQQPGPPDQRFDQQRFDPHGRGGGPDGPRRDDRHWSRGDRIDRRDWDRGQRVDFREHHLRPPPRGYEWREIDGRYVLAGIAGGVIADIILGGR